jgi:tetratricopeptide (TPR) repeat protein
MRVGASLLLLGLLLCGCASAPPPGPPPAALFHDERFAAPTQRIDAGEVFALSDEMRRFLRNDIAAQMRGKGRQRGLVDALYKRGELRLEYDSTMTRNAAQAFDARSGNCLSLVIMTAAFARELGLQLQYQSALHEETWSRSGDLYFRSGHVNITLGRRVIDVGTSYDTRELTIDFLPPEEIRGLRTRVIDERTVVAMYMNNRAVEALVQGQLDDAYAFVREAIAQSPAFVSAFNTLGVIYQRHGDLAPAERAFAEVLQREADNPRALANLAQLLEQQGRSAQAAELHRRLAQVEPHPAFEYFQLGQAAMQRGDFALARELFAKEVERAPYYHEFHFWLGLADFRLGDLEQARRQLALAMENSTTRGDRDLYAAKLAWLQSRQHQ